MACREHPASGKRTWAHTSPETPGAGNNKREFPKWVTDSTQPSHLTVLQQPSADLKDLLTNTFAIKDMLRGKKKERKKENNWRY